MKSLRYLLVLFSIQFLVMNASAQNTQLSLEELLVLAKENNITFRSSELKNRFALQSKRLSALGILNPRIALPASVTNNLQLPVNLFPAEIFGGAPGSFVEVTTGVKYNTSFKQNLNLSLFNLSSWYDFKLASQDQDLTSKEQLLQEKISEEGIADLYYQWVLLEEQYINAQNQFNVADTLHILNQALYNEGQITVQELNQTDIAKLNMSMSMEQIALLKEEVLIALKAMCGLPVDYALSIRFDDQQSIQPSPLVQTNNLILEYSSLNVEKSRLALRRENTSWLPSVDLVMNNNFQNFSQEFSYDNANWIESNYIGLTLNFNLPNANSLKARAQAKHHLELAELELEQEVLDTERDRLILLREVEKNRSDIEHLSQIHTINISSFNKTKERYEEGLLDFDQLLDAYNAMLGSRFNLTSSQVALHAALTKIEINNRYN